jgi:hypothetical protein
MDLGCSFLAKSADVGADGGFNVIGGGISVIAMPAFPSQLQAISVVANVRFRPDECGGVYRLSVAVRNPDGSDAGLAAFMELRPTAAENAPEFGSSLHVAFNIFGLVLPQRGRYSINYSVDNLLIGTLQFYASRIPQNAEAGG